VTALRPQRDAGGAQPMPDSVGMDAFQPDDGGQRQAGADVQERRSLELAVVKPPTPRSTCATGVTCFMSPLSPAAVLVAPVRAPAISPVRATAPGRTVFDMSTEPIHKVFVAGASGAIGMRLVPLLVERGHDVAMSRHPDSADRLRGLGAEPVVADGLDRDAVLQAVMRAEPDAVIHEMTALRSISSMRRFDADFAVTNRLRTEGTDNLLAAARAAGAHRFVAQSYGNWAYDPRGNRAKQESDPLDPDPPARQRRSLAAIRHLERAVLHADGLDGIVLRYASLYGPGTAIAADGVIAPLLRKRQFPIIGDGAGVWSFIHVDDAAAATIAALELGEPGIYNIADDDPAPVAVWLPELARALGAKAPRRVPAWLGRLAAGEVGVSMMTRVHGASNAKAKRELGWQPVYASWRQGFRFGLTDSLVPGGVPT
jgi:2-alkyl-3-oxoalkanoate reductase